MLLVVRLRPYEGRFRREAPIRERIYEDSAWLQDAENLQLFRPFVLEMDALLAESRDASHGDWAVNSVCWRSSSRNNFEVMYFLEIKFNKFIWQ